MRKGFSATLLHSHHGLIPSGKIKDWDVEFRQVTKFWKMFLIIRARFLLGWKERKHLSRLGFSGESGSYLVWTPGSEYKILLKSVAIMMFQNIYWRYNKIRISQIFNLGNSTYLILSCYLLGKIRIQYTSQDGSRSGQSQPRSASIDTVHMKIKKPSFESFNKNKKKKNFFNPFK